MNAEGLPGKPGDKHYKCYHGNRKVRTITRAMRSSLSGTFSISVLSAYLYLKLESGLIGHLKTHCPAMYRLFLLLKGRKEPPTDEEKAIAAGEMVLDPTKATEYLVQLDKASTSIVDIFTQQHQHAAVSCKIGFIFKCIN
jgi:hypothetical protein